MRFLGCNLSSGVPTRLISPAKKAKQGLSSWQGGAAELLPAGTACKVVNNTKVQFSREATWSRVVATSMRGFTRAAALLSSTWASASVIPESSSLSSPSSDAVIQYRNAASENPEMADWLSMLICLQILTKLYLNSSSKVANQLILYDVQCTKVQRAFTNSV